MSTPAQPKGWSLWGRSAGDFVLLGVTALELAFLLWLEPELSVTDWIYICSNLLVLAIALLRWPAQEQDRSLTAGLAVLVSYTYSYAQVALLHWRPGNEAWPAGGSVIVIIGAAMSLVGLLSLGRFFGVRPALRGLSTRGSYRFIRHPLYMAYLVQDIGYNLCEWSVGTLLLVAVGWASMVYRIYAEERLLSHNPEWAAYAQRVRYRLVPGVW